MPNWCGNTLTLTHEDPAMIRRAKAAFAEGCLLEEFIPVPAGLKGTTSPNRDGTAEELREKYGYSDWYDFCVNEWGTKWDIGDGNGIQTWDDHELVVYFDSAWSPPIAAYEKLQDLGFTVYATYYEPGCAFAGIYDECGDNCYNLSEMSSDEVRDELPSELDDAFGISDSMAEYEAENEDEVTTWYKEGVEAIGLEPHKKKVDQ
jgi:hypothetical protein